VVILLPVLKPEANESSRAPKHSVFTTGKIGASEAAGPHLTGGHFYAPDARLLAARVGFTLLEFAGGDVL